MNRFNSKIKQLLISFYRTNLGQRIWKHLKLFCARPFIRKVILRLLNVDPSAIRPNRESFIPLVLAKQSKHALVVFPYFGQNASYQYVRYLADVLRERGYVVHGMLYNSNPCEFTDLCFDVIHNVTAKKTNFGKWNVHKNKPLYEKNELDDWVDDGLLTAVSRLNCLYRFELCLVNYVFLSAAFNALPQSTIKILCTHDVFACRNKKLEQSGVDPEFFSFSVSKDEEKKGLERANAIFSIQEEESRYFKSILNHSMIYTVPYIPDSRFLEVQPSIGIKVVGFIASSHRPNVVAIQEFIQCMEEANFKLLIAGSVCHHLQLSANCHNVEMLGEVENVRSFYEKCDIVINPDTVKSGLKIKCIEGFSFGLPVVCTVAASAGLNNELLTEYQLCKDSVSCFNMVNQLVKSHERLREQAQVSKRIYADFAQKYNAYSQLDSLLNKIKVESSKRIVHVSDFTKPQISVIVPVFNVERYVYQAINCLREQTLHNIEIIAVDDGSPDGCGQILDNFAKIDSRVKVFHQENKGYGKAINVGLEHAQGEFIAILEPDDWIDCAMFEEMYSLATKEDVVIKAGFFKHELKNKISEVNLFGKIGAESFETFKVVDSTLSDLLIAESSIWSAIYRRSFLEENQIRMIESPGASYQDVPWKFLVYSLAGKIKLVNKSYYHYRVMTLFSSSKKAVWDRSFILNYECIMRKLIEKKKFEEVRHSYFAHFYLDMVFHFNRLNVVNREQFIIDVGLFFNKLGNEWLRLEKVIFPTEVEDYVLTQVIPIYKKVVASMKVVN